MSVIMFAGCGPVSEFIAAVLKMKFPAEMRNGPKLIDANQKHQIGDAGGNGPAPGSVRVNPLDGPFLKGFPIGNLLGSFIESRQAESIVMGRAGTYHWGAVSITGNYRENNEDKFLVDPEGRFFLVADGMGGQSAGERASELAIDLISNRLNALVDFTESPPSAVIDGIDKSVSHANAEIMVLGALEPSCKNMGTTIVFIVNINGEFYIGGVGDSRAYLLRNGKLQQLTEDHSLTQALVKAGTISPEDAKTHRYKNVLYRYLGTKEGGTGTEPTKVIPQPGDRFMICSDGVSDGTNPEVLQKVLSTETSPQSAAENLVAAAQAGGSKDNITCVVLFVD